MMPLEVQGHAIPHFKAKINGKFKPKGPRRGSTFTLCHATFKNPVLLHTEGFLPFVLISSVSEGLPVQITYSALFFSFLEFRAVRIIFNTLTDFGGGATVMALLSLAQLSFTLQTN